MSWVPGECGSILGFDGGSDARIDYIVVAYSQSINTRSFTVSIWVSKSDLDVIFKPNAWEGKFVDIGGLPGRDLPQTKQEKNDVATFS